MYTVQCAPPCLAALRLPLLLFGTSMLLYTNEVGISL